MKRDPKRRRGHWWNNLFPGWPFWLGREAAGGPERGQRSRRGLKTSQSECRHVNLLRRWDSADDMGRPEKVSRYLCDACGASFSREEGDRLRRAAR